MGILLSRPDGSLASQPDLLSLCEQKLRRIEALLLDRKDLLLNERQCWDLSSKLSKIIKNIQELVKGSGAPPHSFTFTLESVYRSLEKATLLVENCGQKDWCAASIFQCQNENAFREILLDTSLCYNAIYAQARAISKREDWDIDFHPKDLRQSSVFQPASISDIRADQRMLQQRLQVESNNSAYISHMFSRIPRNQIIAKKVLSKLNYTSHRSQPKASDVSKGVLWGAQEADSSGTWGSNKYLGMGATGSVWSTHWLGIPCAKKIFEHGRDKIFFKEAGILVHLNHPRIVKFICCGNDQETGHKFFAMELMEKSLADVIENEGDISLPCAVDIMVQIAHGLCYMHNEGIAHRDLKPHNVVMSTSAIPNLKIKHNNMKLVDFGVSKTEVEESKANTISIVGVGTTQYRAPEVHPHAYLKGKRRVDWFKADVYSFAITSAHLLSLKAPFGDWKPSELYEDLLKGIRPELPTDCPEELVALIRDCWDTDQSLRPSFIQILTRLETFRHKILRRMSSHQILQGEVDLASYNFIIRQLKEYQRTFVASVYNDEIKTMDMGEQSFVASLLLANTGDEVMERAMSKSTEVGSVGMTTLASVSEANQQVLFDDNSLRMASNEAIGTIGKHAIGVSELKELKYVSKRRKIVLPLVEGMFARTIEFPNICLDEERYAHLQYNSKSHVKPTSVHMGMGEMGSIAFPLHPTINLNKRLSCAEFNSLAQHGGQQGLSRSYSLAAFSRHAMIKDVPLHLLPRPQHPWSLTPLPRFLQGCSIPPPALRVSLLSLVASYFAPELKLPTKEHAIQGEDVVKFSWQ